MEDVLQKHAIFSPNDYHLAPIQDIIKGYDLKPLGKGQFSRVFKLEGTPWVMKEGRWDLSVQIYKDYWLRLNARATERFLRLFNLTFLPYPEEIVRQYKLYLTVAQYLGYFDEEKDYFHPNRDVLYTSQKSIRNSLIFYKSEIERYYGFTLNPNIIKVLESKEVKHNFLPKEYLLAGRAISPQNKQQDTFYIFQEFFTGQLLHDIKKQKNLDTKYKYQLIIFIYLVLLMRIKENILPDTRPRYFVTASNWMTETDNIIVAKEGLKFIDTRWCLDVEGNFAKRQLTMPELIIQSAIENINYLLEDDK